ncbi:unnamed protein product [Cunninghamella echinulata]
MAKKKKIANNRGYATTSAPSKKETLINKNDNTDKSNAEASSTTSTASTTPLLETTHKNAPPSSPFPPLENISTENDFITQLVQQFKSLNDYKANSTLNNLSEMDKLSFSLQDHNIEDCSFSLSDQLKDNFFSLLLSKMKKIILFVGLHWIFNVVYRTLIKLGFHEIDVKSSLAAIVSTRIEDHLDWLCLHVPYDRMPVGYYNNYFTEEELSIKLKRSENSDTSKNVTSNEKNKTPDDLVELKKVKSVDNSSSINDDYKLRILQAAQKFIDEEEEEEESINLKYARIKAELNELEKEVAQIKQQIIQLKQNLTNLEVDWDYDKDLADELYIKEQRRLAEEKQQEKISTNNTDGSINESTVENTIENKTGSIINSYGDEDEDEDGLFGGMMDIMEESIEKTQTTEPENLVMTWDIVNVSCDNWKGNTPKQILEKHCKKLGYVKQVYSRIKKGSSIWQATVILSKKGLDEPTVIVNLPPSVATEKPVDAEQLVAVRALFELDDTLSVYQVMAPPFKDIWLSWKRKKNESEEEARFGIDRDRLQFIYDTLESSLSRSPKKANFSTFDSSLQYDMIDKNNISSRLSKQKELFGGVKEKFNKRLNMPFYKELKKQRNDLPIAYYREEIIKATQDNQVVIISGETGCGKSTQVPQFLAEDLLINGDKYGSIMCTQPRRISAMSIAQRVSKEMGDKPRSIGSSQAMVGYQIRLESKLSDENVLVFCTTGILLRRLESDPWLEGVSHVVVDEVHERSIDSDFLLIILQSLCRLRPDLRIILMSATVNAERFSAYFENCPVLSIPGRTFPVHVQYLEDIIESTGYVLEEDSHYAVKKLRTRTTQGNINITGQHGSTKKVHYELYDADSDSEVDDIYNQNATRSKLSVVKMDDSENEMEGESDQQQQQQVYSKQTKKMIKRIDEYKINYDLIVTLMEHVCLQDIKDETIPKTGAILIFLPGMPEIRRLYDMMASHSNFGDPKKFILIALHSTLSSENQEKAFDIPPQGIRKVVLSTNIAETGVTISDITIVIDTGMSKIVSYDQERKISRLKQMFVAKANAHQRRGRAGRVQEGLCYHLFSKQRYDQMAAYETPEILRLPLEELCLRIKVCKLGSIENVLERALDAPPKKMIDNAIETLQEVQALSSDGNETLTPLGVHLSNLPVDVHIGKMILYGAMFRCLDPILTIAASISFKSPFIRPFGYEEEADKARKLFEQDNSDFLTVYKAYTTWRNKLIEFRQKPGWKRKIQQYCKTYYLSHKNLEMIEEMKKQYLELLISIGFVMVSDVDKQKLEKYDLNRYNRLCQIPSIYNQYGESTAMINAAITAGMYPKVAVYNKNNNTYMRPPNMLNMNIHPSSTLYHRHTTNTNNSEFLVYNTVVMNNDKIFLWENGIINPATLILFSNDLVIKHNIKYMVVDNWLKFKCFARTGVLMKFLRHELIKWLEDKINQPSMDLTSRTQNIMELIVKVLEN